MKAVLAQCSQGVKFFYSYFGLFQRNMTPGLKSTVVWTISATKRASKMFICFKLLNKKWMKQFYEVNITLFEANWHLEKYDLYQKYQPKFLKYRKT